MAETMRSKEPLVLVYVCSESLVVAELEKELASKQIRYHEIINDPLPISANRKSRPAFVRLMKSLKSGDRLYVPSLGSFGPNLKDALHSIWHFKNLGVSLYCMQLAPVDLTSTDAQDIISTLSCALEICHAE